MKLSNFFKSAPAWLSNVLSLIFALLVLINTTGPDLLKFFTDINCQSCISIVNTVLGSVAFLLGIFKVFSSSEIPKKEI